MQLSLLDHMRDPPIIEKCDGAGSVVHGKIDKVLKLRRLRHNADIQVHEFDGRWAWQKIVGAIGE